MHKNSAPRRTAIATALLALGALAFNPAQATVTDADILNDDSLELHGRMGVSKNEVRAQYGDNSNQIASLGLKKKSEHRSRRPKKVKAEE